jgi:CubicO group peptidase (beta-lactamase class C family)
MLKVDADPGEVGLDPDRLRRLDDAFRSYVDDGRLPGWTIAVTRRGKVAHLTHHGLADLESGRPVGDDTLWRIYSMTKPITSVAAMMLYEQGRFELTDPVSKFIPEFADARVYVGGAAAAPAPARRSSRSGCGTCSPTPRASPTASTTPTPSTRCTGRAGYEFWVPDGQDLAAACAGWARFPLLFDPGAEWNYSVATDVLGRVVEVVSGLPLDRFFAERIFGPLGMTDTAFSVPADDLERLATLYVSRGGHARPAQPDGSSRVTEPVEFFSGGGGLGLLGADYHRFTQMLARGGELDGVRLLSPRTLGLHDAQPPARRRRPRRDRAAAVRRVAVPGRRVRPRVLRRAGPGAGQGAVQRGRVRLGRARAHRVLRRPRRGDHRDVLHPVVARAGVPLRTQLRALVTAAVVD